MREDKSFEERIAREAIRAVQPGASHLADRIESRQAGGAVHVGFDSAALIMRRRYDRDRLLRHIDPVTQAGFVNVRETFLQKFSRLMGDIEINALRAGAFHLGIDRPGHDIARRERSPAGAPAP